MTRGYDKEWIMAEILVVEDDDELRRLVCRRLTLAGHQVAEAQNGLAALRQIQGHVPELIISDIVMPDMDGLELIRNLQKEHPRLRILAVTGGGATDPALRLALAKRLGAADTLYKPFSFDELLEKVSMLLTS